MCCILKFGMTIQNRIKYMTLKKITINSSFITVPQSCTNYTNYSKQQWRIVVETVVEREVVTHIVVQCWGQRCFLTATDLHQRHNCATLPWCWDNVCSEPSRLHTSRYGFAVQPHLCGRHHTGTQRFAVISSVLHLRGWALISRLMVRESGFHSSQYLSGPNSLSLLSFRLCMKMGPQMARYKINREAVLGFKVAS